MPTKVDTASEFERAFKRLKRKYPHLRAEFNSLLGQLKADQRPGDKIPGVGYDTYKVRMRNPSAGKGKRGGFRAVYYVRLADFVVLLTIYAKSEQTDISAEQLCKIIEGYQPPQENTPEM